MAEPFVGEIRLFPYLYAPKDWAFCDGQTLPVQQNPALYSLLQTYYGGDGINTFALPDMRGRVPMHMGQGVGLTLRRLGDKVGTEQVYLDANTLPQHNHNLTCSTHNAEQTSPVDAIPAVSSANFYSSSLNSTREMVPGMIDEAGGNLPHDNVMPFIALYYCISLKGTYPSRN